MSLNEVLNNERASRLVRINGTAFLMPNPVVECVDGYEVSIQCQSTSYCTPRENLLNVAYYTEFELGFPNMSDELLDGYAESHEDYTDTVYPYVPRSVVEALIEKHGGIKTEGKGGELICL